MKNNKKYRIGLRIRNRALEKAKNKGLNTYKAYIVEEVDGPIAYSFDGEKIVYYNLK